MRSYTYHREIRILLAQVLNALGDLVIRRINEVTDDIDEPTLDKIDVGLKYSPKQRIIYDMVNLNQHIQLPTMCINMASIQYDAERAFNKITGFTVSSEILSGGGRFPQPVPIKLVLPWSLLGRYQRDVDQILTCIFANFFPYIVISYRHPDLDMEVRCVVKWDGNINLNYPIDVPATTNYRIGADSTFTVLGWIYRNANNPWGIIHHIDTSFTSVSDIIDDFPSMQALERPEASDYFTISGRPQLNSIDPYFTNIGVSSTTFNLIGDMFQFVDGIAISGTPQEVYPLSAYQFVNPFVSSVKLSSVYQGFSGVPLLTSDWTFINDNHIQLSIPTPLTTGFVDVFAYSEIGLGRLTVDSVRPTLNPYPTFMAEFSSYQEFQYPYVSGVEIR